MSDIHADLTEALYSILLGEADWSRFLGLLVSDRANGGALFMLQNERMSGGLGRLELTSGIGTRQISDYATYYSQLNPWVPDHLLRANDVIVDHQVIAREVLKRTEFYNDFLRPAGYIGSTGVTLGRRGSEHMLLTMVFGDSDPEIATMMGRQLEALTPHLQRVMRHFANLGREVIPGNFATEALGVIGTGLCVIGDDLKPTLISPAAEEATRRAALFTLTPTGRIHFADEAARQFLGQILARGYDGPTEHVWHQNGCRLTLFRAAREPISELLCGPAAGLIIEEGQVRSEPLRIAHFQQRYALSAAETRVLTGITQGLSIRAIADAHSRSVETIRSQVKSLLHKTGSDNQLALIQRLNGRG
ncbi:LuxR C-terminal-related transcriptional regulator [Paracoccus sp. IB05]|uniref:helix-turn-helix transcriptional regulator n=1 Tax=Paracoccus sp. IB05 TaxID=2779367 RepID=UPI0018E7905B|nr:LuxR C-terminal-related transcriptional regulator [Paracoccus sp. IB05]MBJ2150972.1 hypothetical protein [Paracoccus sp. IB05]